MDILWLVIGVLVAALACFGSGYAFAWKKQQKKVLERENAYQKLQRISLINQYGTRIDATVVNRKIRQKSETVSYNITAEWYGPETRIRYSRMDKFIVYTKYVQMHKVPEIGGKVFVLHMLGYDPKTHSYIERP